MKLSIITPVYNGEKKLENMIKSVCNQKFTDWELILVNDGSTDGSQEICDKYSKLDNRIKVIHKINEGVSSARNVGILASKGEWIGFVDCDDCIKPDMYSKLLNAVNENKCDLVMGSYEKVDFNEKKVISLGISGSYVKDNITEIMYSMAFWNGYLNGKFLTTIYGSVWPNLYNAKIIKEYLVSFPSNVSLGEDLLFNLNYLRYVEKVFVLDEPLYEYSISDLSATRKLNNDLWNQYKILLDQVGILLASIFGNISELEYNIQKQYINFAISFIEEQICICNHRSERIQKIKKLCSDEFLLKSSRYIMKNGKRKKDKFQAMLFALKSAFLIDLWLRKGGK